jgi:transcriptional regulator with XRE-family HTH domain
VRAPRKGRWRELQWTFSTGGQLTAARALAGLTALELADSAGVAARTIHRLEIGRRHPLRLAGEVAISEHFIEQR